jgi:SpoVK/Ycf46/Vps4 family AAA+-type ATPase
MLSTGRLDEHVFLGPPDNDARHAILHLLLEPMPLQQQEAVTTATKIEVRGEDETIDVSAGDMCVREAELRSSDASGLDLSAAGRHALCAFLATRTEGYSGADLRNLVREAAMLSLRLSDMRATHVTAAHFVRAMRSTAPTLKGIRIHHPYEEDNPGDVALNFANFTS